MQVLSPAINSQLLNRIEDKQVRLYEVTLRNGSKPATLLESKLRSIPLYLSKQFVIYRIQATTDELKLIIKDPALLFIETGERAAKEETLVSTLDLSVNKVNLAHRNFSSINGDAVVVSLKENRPDSTDIDFHGRYLSTHLSSPVFSAHASTMATMIAGGGNNWHLGKGAAWGGTISSSSFAVLLPESNSNYVLYNISVQNHSYGVGVENYYGADAAAYDASVNSNNSLVHVFSSGNSGTSSAASGPYTGIAGFANLTGSFKMAKNIITVGATDSFHTVAALSSKGPAHDGRVKPGLVAFGEDGSSGAAALVSGTAMLLQHEYKTMQASMPSNALIRALLYNSADDVGTKEVDYSSGYGSLNAKKAMEGMAAGHYFNGAVSQNTSQLYNISVPAGIRKVKVTLTWNDPPAAPNANKALINDLDLELINTGTAQIYKPWVLSSFPHRDSLLLPATRKRDSLNNAEQVTVDDPPAGNYQIKVNGYSVNGNQPFYLAYQFDTADKLEWQFPASVDFIYAGTSNNIRWYSSYNGGTGNIEYSLDNGNNWQIVQSNVNLSSGHIYWNVPAVSSKALLRMTIGASSFVSDTFTISQRTVTGVGFNCPDSFLVYWTKIPGVSTYRFYNLGPKYLEPKFTTTASQVVLAKSAYPSPYFAVAPLISDREGMKSYTLDYTGQGVGCYVISLVGIAINNTAQLTLTIGSLYNVSSIILEKLEGSVFIPVQQVSPGGLQVIFTDNNLKKGLNIYRVKIILNNGSFVYSGTETVYYFAGATYLVFPNPVPQSQPVKIYSAATETATIQVFNMIGQKVHEQFFDNFNREIPGVILGKGLYIVRIISSGGNREVFKIIVY
jgi:hypothetical protein